MTSRQFSNTAVETTLATGINGAVTTLDVVSAAGWPISPFVAVIDEGTANEEIVLVGNKSGVTFGSLTRGYGGTAAVAHNAGVSIQHAAIAEDHRLVFTHIHVPGTDGSAQINHDDLSGVSANDHHAQAHSISGADHTGQLDHGNLLGLSDDDHPQYLKEKASGGLAAEIPDHTHSGGGGGGGVDHGTLTGLGDDDHPQYLTPAEAQAMFYPVGSIYLQAGVGTNPATLLGFGTWTAFGAGRMLVGLNGADVDFDTVEETGGAKTHLHTMGTHTHTQPTHTHSTPNHTHTDTFAVGASTAGGTSGPSENIAGDDHFHSLSGSVSSSGASTTGADGNDTTGATDPGDTASSSGLPPYIVVYMWKRTA